MVRWRMQLIINGNAREFAALTAGATVELLIAELGLKGDRVAVEVNGQIVPRSRWEASELLEADRLEVVHFVGGGSQPFK